MTSLPTSLPIATCLAAIALSSVAASQQTLVVDASGGTPFPEISAAVAAADPGDTILVRAGNYLPFQVDEGISILADDNVTVTGGFTVQNVAAGPPLTIRNLFLILGHPSIHVGLHMSNCAGAVHLDQIDFTSSDGATIANCDLVTLRQSILFGGFVGLHVTSSNVHVDSTRITCGGAVANGVALKCEGSTVHAGSARLTGDRSFFFTQPTQAIHLISGQLTLGADTTVEAGVPQSAAPTVAIRTDGGQLILDTGVVVNPENGGQPITGPAAVTNTTVPAIESGGGQIGGLLTGIVHAPAGQLAVTLLALPTTPVATPWGELWLGTPLFVIDSGTVPGNGERDFALAIPANFPAGGALAVQAVAVVNGRLHLSTPSTTVLGQ